MSEHVGADTVTTDGPEVFFNPLQPGYVEDPWRHFAEMRSHDPVHLTLMNQWLLFTYDDVSRLLRDPSLSVSEANIEIMDEKRHARLHVGRHDIFQEQRWCQPARSILSRRCRG